MSIYAVTVSLSLSKAFFKAGFVVQRSAIPLVVLRQAQNDKGYRRRSSTYIEDVNLFIYCQPEPVKDNLMINVNLFRQCQPELVEGLSKAC
jgi:hypothetical protein